MMVDFTEADCIHDDGNIRLNYDLAVNQGLDKRTVEIIRQLQMLRVKINTALHASSVPLSIENRTAYYGMLTKLEYTLQSAWGFELAECYHPHLSVMIADQRMGLHLDPKGYMH